MEEIKRPYAVWHVGDEDYKLRLSASASVDAEDKMGCSMLESLQRIDSVKVQLILLWASAQRLCHGIGMAEIAQMYDEYLDEPQNDMGGIISLITEVLQVSGFIPRDAELPHPETKVPNPKTPDQPKTVQFKAQEQC